jgi:uncharacterized Ntn-hydrolase superfamily protein
MTVSICVRERYTGDDGTPRHRFGVAVTASVPGVGALSPVASADGAVATQGVVNAPLGREAVEALADGESLDSALDRLLDADPDADRRQVHGVDGEGAAAVTGEACHDWCGHRETGQYTVAGTHLTGEAVLDAVAGAYERHVPDPGGSAAKPLAGRLVDALAAGRRAGGDRRDDLQIRSAAVVVARTEQRSPKPYYDDLRVDASETPIRDLRETFELARRGHRQVLAKYGADDRSADAGPDAGPPAGGDSDDGFRSGSRTGLDAEGLAAFVDATAPDALSESIRPADLVTGTGSTDESRDAVGDQPAETGKRETGAAETGERETGAAETSERETGTDEQ